MHLRLTYTHAEAQSSYYDCANTFRFRRLSENVAAKDAPLDTIYIQPNEHNIAVLHVERASWERDLLPFHIQTCAQECIIIINDGDRDKLYQAIVNRRNIPLTETNSQDENTPRNFKIQVSITNGEPAVDRSVTFMNHTEWARQKKQIKIEKDYSRLYFHWLKKLIRSPNTKSMADLGMLLLKSGPGIIRNINKCIIAFMTPKLIPACLRTISESKSLVNYSINLNDKPQEYQYPLPKDGMLDLNNIRHPENNNNILYFDSIASPTHPINVPVQPIDDHGNYNSLISIKTPAGLTQICQEAFRYFDELTNVELLGDVSTSSS